MTAATTYLPKSAFTAFENNLKSLCLAEYPCGTGNWVCSISIVIYLQSNLKIVLSNI